MTRRQCPAPETGPGAALPAAFWANVDRSAGPNECWPWTAGRAPDGYGMAYVAGKLRGAHALVAGTVGTALQTRHTCDNPPCCNPAHLLPGTAADNAADRVARGRQADQRGELNGTARLTELHVRAIRAAHGRLTQPELAEAFGVTRSNVSAVQRRVSWAHVGG